MNDKKALKENETLKEKIYETILNNNEIDFDKIATDFGWDEIYILIPYTNPKDFLKSENIKWNKINNLIESNDGINLILFLKEKEVVSYLNRPRNYGDFIFTSPMKFDRNSAKFKINKIDNWINLIPNRNSFAIPRLICHILKL